MSITKLSLGIGHIRPVLSKLLSANVSGYLCPLSATAASGHRLSRPYSQLPHSRHHRPCVRRRPRRRTHRMIVRPPDRRAKHTDMYRDE